jgi:hypothetical protein
MVHFVKFPLGERIAFEAAGFYMQIAYRAFTGLFARPAFLKRDRASRNKVKSMAATDSSLRHLRFLCCSSQLNRIVQAAYFRLFRNHPGICPSCI